jgi:uncharacterized membrane protein YphA (DoxX/SURF4 family)
MTLDPVLSWSLRLALALLFSAAAWHKLADPRRFAATMRAYDLVPEAWALPLGWLFVLVEGTVAVGLVSPPAYQTAAVAAATVLSIYTAAISLNLARGRREIDCGCFASTAKVPLGPGLVLRNLALIAAAVALLLPVRVRAWAWVDGVTVMSAVLAASLLWAAGQRLAQTGPRLRRLGGLR